MNGELITLPEVAQVATPAQPTTPMEMLSLAVSQGADLDKISKLMDLQERWEAGNAKRAFVQAMSNFKAETINVTKDKDNLQYKSKYVSLGNLVNTVTPFLSKHGLSVRWAINQSSGIEVTCIVTHIQGHSESVSFVAPPDKSGAKNPIQEIKSAVTYAKACTFESICGLASTDQNMDDDGNGFGMEEDTFQGHLKAIRTSKDIAALQVAYEKAKTAAGKDRVTLVALAKAKDERKAELRGAK